MGQASKSMSGQVATAWLEKTVATQPLRTWDFGHGQEQLFAGVPGVGLFFVLVSDSRQHAVRAKKTSLVATLPDTPEPA